MTGSGSGYKGMKYKNFSQQKRRLRILDVAVIVKQRQKNDVHVQKSYIIFPRKQIFYLHGDMKDFCIITFALWF